MLNSKNIVESKIPIPKHIPPEGRIRMMFKVLLKYFYKDNLANTED